MTANHEYSRSNRENLPLPFKCNYLKNHSPFFKLFITFLKSKLNFEHFENKNCASKLKYFWSYLLQKTRFLKCVKGLVSENPLAVNVLTSLKNCWHLQKSTFILLFHYFEATWVRKCHFLSDLGFEDCFLLRWLPTTSILVGTGGIYRYQFKCNYLKNQKHFLNFLFHFWSRHYILNILK